MDVRWKTQSDKKIKIKSKDEMREDGIESPDNADAFMITFSKTTFPAGNIQDEDDKLFERHGIFPSVD